MKFTARTVSPIAMLGGTQIHHSLSRTWGDWAALTICPQLAVGGRTPRPRKLRPASIRIALATPNVRDDRKWAENVREYVVGDDSSPRDADDLCGEDVFSLAQREDLASDKAGAVVQLVNAIAITTAAKLGPVTDTKTITSRSEGTAIAASVSA